MSKEEFLGLIQSEAFKAAIENIVQPMFNKLENKIDKKFNVLSDEMAEFRDEVLAREDLTVHELRHMREELNFFGNRLVRIEEFVGLD